MEKNSLNDIVQEKLKVIENKLVPGSNWDKAKSWTRIRDILDTKNKKLILWYFAMAASVSLVFATALNDNLNILKDTLEHIVTPSSELSQIDADQQTEETQVLQRKAFETSKIEGKSLRVGTEYNASVRPQFYLQEEDVQFHKETTPEITHVKHIQIEPTIGVSAFGNSSHFNPIMPTVDLSMKYNLMGNGVKRSYVAIGLKSSLISKLDAEGVRSEFYPATFITSKYGQTKLKNGAKPRSWEVEAGYLINPDHVIYDDTTFRFQYNRTIVGKLRGGPELIFTNKFSKIYPGFTLIFG